MFSIPKLLMLSLAFTKSATAYFGGQDHIKRLFANKVPTIVSPTQEPQLPWDRNSHAQCDQETWDNAQQMREMVVYEDDVKVVNENNVYSRFDNVDKLFDKGFTLDALLTEDEQTNYDSLMKIFHDQVYVRYPKKLEVTWSAEQQVKAEEELRTICAAVASGEVQLTTQDFDDGENCMFYPLKSNNAIFDPNKYPNIHAFVVATEKTLVCFDNDSTLSDAFQLHVDDADVMNLNTESAMSTIISPYTKFKSINLETFNIKERILKSIQEGRIRVTTTSTNHAVDALAIDFGAKIALRSLYHALFSIGQGKALEAIQPTYLPSGGAYKVNGAVHSSPPITNNKQACRLFF